MTCKTKIISSRYPFVSSPSAGLQPLRINLANSQDETPIRRALLHSLSSSLEANGNSGFYIWP